MHKFTDTHQSGFYMSGTAVIQAWDRDWYKCGADRKTSSSLHLLQLNLNITGSRSGRSASPRKLNAKWSQGENGTHEDSIATIKMCDVLDSGRSIWGLSPKVNNTFDDAE